MKFINLKIHNIASIQDAEIDFRAWPLKESGVFLISGVTGSGKSTILDSICLALYDETPRLKNCLMNGKQRDVSGEEISLSETRQLLRRGAGEGYVKLTFIGHDGVKYLAHWSVRRARDKASGTLRSKVWTLSDFDSERILTSKISETRDYLRRVIDLDFEQFCRTTMLAQGDFNRFLNSKDDDKSSILEKIIGNKIYTRIGKAVFARTSEKKQIYNEILSRCENIVVMSEEDIATVENECDVLSLLNIKLSEETKIWTVRQDWLTREKSLQKEYSEVVDNLKIIGEKVNSEEFIALQKLTEDVAKSGTLRNLVVHRKNLSDAIVRLRAQEPNLQRRFQELSGQIITLENFMNNHRQTELRLFDISKLKCDIPGIPDYEKGSDKSAREVEECWIDSIDNWVNKQEQKDFNGKLSSVIEYRSDLKLFQEAQNNLSDARKRRDEAKAELEKMKNELESLEKIEKIASQQEKTAKVNAEKASELYARQKASVDKWAREMRRTLTPGDKCPVCNREIIKTLPTEDEFDRMIAPVAEAAEKAASEWDEAMARLNKICSELKVTAKNYAKAQKTFKADKSVDNCVGRVTALSGKIKHFITDDKVSIKEIDLCLTDKERELRQECERVKRLRTRINLMRSDFNKRKKEADKSKAEAEELSVRINEIKATITQIVSHRESWDTLEPIFVKRADNHVDVLLDLISHDTELVEKRTQLNETSKAIENERNNHPEWDDEYIEKLFAVTPEEEKYNQKYITDEQNKFTRAEENLRNIEKRLKNHIAEKPDGKEEWDIGTCDERLKNLANETRNNLEEIGRKKQILKHDADAKKRLSKELETLKTAEDDYNRWAKINCVIGNADGKLFRKIALSYVLENLVVAANSYMSNLFPRYRLSIRPGSYTIYVRDNYSDDTERSVAGISGGETFVVSLALALALADIGGKVSPDILFIDEGFGSLSGEPLHRAIETLRMLSDRAGRQVGIISHIEELRERIPVQIRVSQMPGNASSAVDVFPKTE